MLTAALLVAGLLAPATADPAPVLPPTVAKRLDGLPAAQRGGRVSRQVQAPIPFSMVGFQVPEGATLEFRTSIDGRGWGRWTEAPVDPEEGPDTTSPEGRGAATNMSAPVWVGEAAHLQTRLRGPGNVAKPEKADVHLIDSSGLGRSWGQRVADRLSAAWRGTPPKAHALANRPDIISRAGWGANESWRRSGPSYSSRIVMGFVHHTAGSNGYTRAQSDDVVRGVYSYHVFSNGWSDIGYNFLVDRFGRIYEGRYGGVTKAVIGAHAGGFNSQTFGVSLMGTFTSQRPSTAMRAGLRRILAWKFDLNHINVLGSTDYTSYGSTRYSYGQTVPMKRLSGHRDGSSTSCPGAKVYDLLPDLRRGVAKLQGPVVLNPKVSPRTIEVVEGRSVSGPINFKGRLRPAGGWTVKISDLKGNVVHRRTGSGESLSYNWFPTSLSPGTYRYAIGGPNRRPATGRVYAKGPKLSGKVSPSPVTYGADGLVSTPLVFKGDLYTNAEWKLRVFDPDGVRVLLRRGTGATMSRTWSGPFVQPGRYTWRLTAPWATPATGSFRVYADRVDRTAAATGSAAAAAGISRRTFGRATAARAVVASTAAPGYALAAAGLAGTDGPVLYTGADAVPDRTVKELRRVLRSDAPVYVLGNAGVISEDVLVRLQTELAPRLVQRVAGKDAPIVSAQAADLVAARTGASSAVVVGTGGGGSWRHSVAAGAVAAARGLPVLVTRPDALSPAVGRALSRNAITATKIIGNAEAVSGAVRRQLPGTHRVAGPAGPATAVAVAQKLFQRTTAAANDDYVFAGTQHPDGWTRPLAAAALAARTSAPVLIGKRDSLPGVTADYLGTLNYRRKVLGRGVVLGNRDHISPATETTLARLLQ